uniref:Uncharacterized protein n=1 Tax=Pithovirus LCDPAC01 TaxID=2506600 RepID=A0A481YQC7_9VIRU|nr:MAG: hypothetical protein LCDPAC01_01040 [Pithovirus LCDPAC01]
MNKQLLFINENTSVYQRKHLCLSAKTMSKVQIFPLYNQLYNLLEIHSKEITMDEKTKDVVAKALFGLSKNTSELLAVLFIHFCKLKKEDPFKYLDASSNESVYVDLDSVPNGLLLLLFMLVK